MGITGLIPFIEKASRRANVSEFSGCTVAIDSYCWLHKGAFACADKLVRGEQTDVHIKYCLKYVSMLLSKNVKPILVFDGRHLPAKAMTEAKRRESRDISKKRAAELLSLGKTDEARSYMRRSVDITHSMALALIKECRKRNVDCIVAPYEADAQLAYLNIKNIAHLVITEDSDLILFGCTKVLFKMDLEGTGTLVDTIKLPLVMKCPIEHYSFDKFRQMCIMSGCDYLASLPGIGLAKARQFVNATQDSNFANALRKLPSFFNRSSLVVTDEYRESFLKAEATFKHQYVYDPVRREMVRLTDVDDDELEEALCGNAGQLLAPEIAFQLALGNLDPFTLKTMDDWHPDIHGAMKQTNNIKTNSWKDITVSNHKSIWSKEFIPFIEEERPWQKKVRKLEPIITKPETRIRSKVVTLVQKYVPETQDESLTIESLSSMYCIQPDNKKRKMDDMDETEEHNNAILEENIHNYIVTRKDKSPILETNGRTFKKAFKNTSYSILKRLSKFPRTVMGDNIVESKFFSTSTESTTESNGSVASVKNVSNSSLVIEESPEKNSRNPFKVRMSDEMNKNVAVDNQSTEILDSQLENSQKENSPQNSPVKRPTSPILPSPKVRNPFKARLNIEILDNKLSEDSVIENTYPLEKIVTPVDSQSSFGDSPTKMLPWNNSQPISGSNNIINDNKPYMKSNGAKKSTCRVPGLKRTTSLPTNQPTLLSKFGFQKKPALKR